MRASKLRTKTFFLDELMQHWTLSTPTLGSWDQSTLRPIFEPHPKNPLHLELVSNKFPLINAADLGVQLTLLN